MTMSEYEKINTKFEWKRDPSNDCWVGPDGCHYDEKWEARNIGVLGMCGCGWPEETFNFLRQILSLFDRRKEPWINAEKAVEKLVIENPRIAAHTLLHFLSDKNVLEHGGSVGGSWTTERGNDIVDGEPAPSPDEALGNEESD